MNTANTNSLQPGDFVRLISKPEGCYSQHLPLTVGSVYQIKYFDGSNVVTTTDLPGETGSYWNGRIEKWAQGESS